MKHHRWILEIDGLSGPGSIVRIRFRCKICGVVRQREMDAAKVSPEEAEQLAQQDAEADARDFCAGPMN